MSTYVIGDLQGCLQQLKSLIKLTSDDAISKPQWYFVGDLVNRGPSSLQTLHFVRSLGDQAKVILGNHDLHLLAAAHGIRKIKKDDSMKKVLAAPDRNELLDWLRRQPLACMVNEHLLVHAGVLPDWTKDKTLALANEVEAVLRSPQWVDFLKAMYGNEPAKWNDALAGYDRLRCIVNALTRLRFCTSDGEMEFEENGGVAFAPDGYLPWFEAPNRLAADTTIVFGHWSTLGLMLRPNLIALDTGCVWGGKLTAIRLEDRKLYQVDCPSYQIP